MTITKSAYQKLIDNPLPQTLHTARCYKNDARAIEIVDVIPPRVGNFCQVIVGRLDGYSVGAINGEDVNAGDVLVLEITD